MKLYALPMSPFAARVRIAIRARGLPVEIVAPPEDWRTSAAWRTISPLGRVPVLTLDGGAAVAESLVILEYLEDAFRERPLRPASPEAAARVRLAVAIGDEAQAALQQVLDAMSPKTGLDAATGPALLARLGQALDRLETVIDAGPYGVGGTISLVDCCLTPLRFTLGQVGPMIGADPLMGRPKLAAYEQTVERDPALRRERDDLTEALVAFLREWGQEVGVA